MQAWSQKTFAAGNHQRANFANGELEDSAPRPLRRKPPGNWRIPVLGGILAVDDTLCLIDRSNAEPVMPSDDEQRARTSQIGSHARTSFIGEIIVEINNTDDEEFRNRKIKHLVMGSRRRFEQMARRILAQEQFKDLQDKAAIDSDELINQFLTDRFYRKDQSQEDLIARIDSVDPSEFYRIVGFYMRKALLDFIRSLIAKGREDKRRRSELPVDALPGNRVDFEKWHRRHAAYEESLRRRQALIEAIDDLEEEPRKLIELRYFAQLTRREIAAEFEVSTKSIDRHTANALKTLGGLIKKRLAED